MNKKIITISREFGSGGRSIGKAVAEKLGIAYYDREIIERVAEETGYSQEFIEDRGEYSPTKSIFSYSFVDRGIDGMSVEDKIWAIQRKIILEIADKEPCVIVGRCADFILKDRKDCLNVFIYADMDKRAERIVKLYGETEQTPVKRLQEKDKKRKIYYKFYTDQDWGKVQNYHLALNSGYIGIDKCVDIIADLAK